MNILLTNDDGIDAPGLRAAFQALRDKGDVHVVAPSFERSACSHTITLRSPITVQRISHPCYGIAHSVDGTPADCVRLALAELVEDQIDLTVSGINQGANAGVDTFYSGTVAAAREAAILGIRAIAFSHAVRRGVEPDWSPATQLTDVLISRLLEEELPGPGFWCVNYPTVLPADALNRIRRVSVAAGPMPMAFERLAQHDGSVQFAYTNPYWSREVESPTDYSVIRDGEIAISAIPLFGRF
jgi:5'-nucleotidase